MTRCCPNLDDHLAEVDALAVDQLPNREIGLRTRPVRNGGAGGLGQLEVPGQEICMDVGLDDLLDGQSMVTGVGEITRDVTLRVDHNGPPGRGVTDQVAEQRQTPELVLVEIHVALLFPVARWAPTSGTTIPCASFFPPRASERSRRVPQPADVVTVVRNVRSGKHVDGADLAVHVDRDRSDALNRPGSLG